MAAPALSRRAVEARALVEDVTIDGCRVRWRRFGDGPPLVLLHGGHGSWAHWVRNVDALATRFGVWLPDMPGFGDSASLGGDPHDPGRLDRLVAILAKGLTRTIGVTTPYRLGAFSFGGTVAATLATRDARVSRLALIGSGGHGGRRRQTVPLADWRAVAGPARREALRQNLYAFMLSAPLDGPDAEALDALALDVHVDACERTRFRSRAISVTPLLPAALARFDRPVLLAWGSDDVTADPAVIAPALAAGHPGRQWRIIERAGHWAQFERAETVDAMLLDFL